MYSKDVGVLLRYLILQILVHFCSPTLNALQTIGIVEVVYCTIFIVFQISNYTLDGESFNPPLVPVSHVILYDLLSSVLPIDWILVLTSCFCGDSI